MKKAIISSLIISLIPGLCAAEHPRVAQLIAEKQQKMKKLEDCKGTTKALKIAGISTLGLTAVGVAGNIAEAVVLSNAKDDVKKAKSELKKQEERQEELQSQKEEQEAKAAEAEAKAKYGSKCINLTKDGQTASFVDSVCRITSSTELKIKENAQSEISKIVGGVCENVRETSTSNTFDAKCDGMSVRVQFGGTSITQSEKNKLDAKKKLIEVCNSDWSGKYNEAEDVCIIDKTNEEPVVANNILSTVQGYVNGASCVATTSYSNNTYETECSGMRVRVMFKEIKTADRSACESFGGRQPSGQLCQIQFDKTLVVMDNETVMNAVVNSVEQYIKKEKKQNVQCFAGNKVDDYKESGKTSFTVGCGDNTNMDILVTFRGVECLGDKKWDSAQMECAKPTEAKQEVKQDAKREVDETTFKLAGFNKNIVQVRRLIKWHSDNIAKLGVDPNSCKIDDIVSGKYGEDTVECDNKAFKFNSLNRYDSNAEKDLRKYFCSVFSGPAETECPGYNTAVDKCIKYILDNKGTCEKKTDEDLNKPTPKTPVSVLSDNPEENLKSVDQALTNRDAKDCPSAVAKVESMLKNNGLDYFSECKCITSNIDLVKEIKVACAYKNSDTAYREFSVPKSAAVEEEVKAQKKEVKPLKKEEAETYKHTFDEPVAKEKALQAILTFMRVLDGDVDAGYLARGGCPTTITQDVECKDTKGNKYEFHFRKLVNKELVVNERVFEPNMLLMAKNTVKKQTSEEFSCETNPYNAEAECTTKTGNVYNVKFSNFIKNDDVKKMFANDTVYPADALKKVNEYITKNNASYTACHTVEYADYIECDDWFQFLFRKIKWIEDIEDMGGPFQSLNEAISHVKKQYDNNLRCNPPVSKSKKLVCLLNRDGYDIAYNFKFKDELPTK